MRILKINKGKVILSLIIFCFSIYLSFCFYLVVKGYNKPIIQSPNIDLFPKWAINLGTQMIELRHNSSSLNQVVIVPDEETFLLAIQDWNLKKRYPILIKDSKYTPLFINRFQPEKIINLPSVKNNKKADQIHKTELMYQAIANAWNAKNYQSVKAKWQQIKWQPPGVVITAENDSASLAAVALAAYRGQPLMFLNEKFGSPNGTLNFKKWQKLQNKVEDLVKSTGYKYNLLGDEIDTITLAKNLAVKYKLSPNKAQELAVTDGLARNKNGKRWAIAGWIYGSSIKSVYMAMSSLFLEQKTAFLYNSYPVKKPFTSYELKNAKNTLKSLGMKVNLFDNPNVNLKKWRQLTKQSWQYDLIMINSRGGTTGFDVGKSNAIVSDIPISKVPTIIHLIHSWSATAPDDIDTVAGRWLENGAYAYVGSVHEPYLSAFVPPIFLTQRISFNVPFLIASRYLDSPPWKITTIGDPLMTILVEK